MKRLRVGITIGLQQVNESLWVNGIKQTALALASLLQASPCQHQVVLLNTTDVPLDGGLAWSIERFPTHALSAYTAPLDVLILLGGAVEGERLARLRQAGTRVIAYKCGSEYIASMQAVLFQAELPGQAHFTTELDALWLLPQVAELNQGFYETLHRQTAQVVPFVWNPEFLEAACAELPHGGLYQPSTQPHIRPARLTCMEPNRDVLKYCLYPMLITETVFRAHPEKIEQLSVTNTQRLRESHEFRSVVGHLEIVRQGRCYFEDTYPTPWFLAHHTDVVLSHQWGNPLNYAYLEAAWLGYPLVHNAELCKTLGYFYPGQSVAEGALALMRALDDNDGEYLARQRTAIAPYLYNTPDQIATYDVLLEGVMQRGAKGRQHD